MTNARKLPDPIPWQPSQYTGISIAQDPFTGDFAVPDDFRVEVEKDLLKLISKDRGKQLMKLISDGCRDRHHEVVIQYNATYKDEVLSENWIRDEWNLTPRTSYSGYAFGDTRATLFGAK